MSSVDWVIHLFIFFGLFMALAFYNKQIFIKLNSVEQKIDTISEWVKY